MSSPRHQSEIGKLCTERSDLDKAIGELLIARAEVDKLIKKQAHSQDYRYTREV